MMKIEPSKEAYSLIEAPTLHWPGGKHSEIYPREVIRLAFPSYKRTFSIDLMLYQRQEFQDIYRELTVMRTKAIDNVGHLEDKLDSLLIDFFTRFPVECRRVKLIGANVRDEIKSLSFMQCRDILSEILNVHQELGGRNRQMTGLFFDVIVERNKYAHGVFYFLKDYKALMQYESKRNKVFGCVSIDHIRSFNIAVLDLLEWLVELSGVVRGLASLKKIL